MPLTSERSAHQDERFYYLFSQLASRGLAASLRFQSLLDDFTNLSQGITDIRLIEHEADVLVHELQSRLNNARVTPLDREDIFKLTGYLDDIVDHIEEMSDRLMLFRIAQPTDHLLRFADVLVRTTQEVELSVEALSENDRATLHEHCHQINELENEADQILREALHHLFSGLVEPLEVVKWKDIYDLIESAIDACEDVSDTLETAAVKSG